MSGFGSGSAAIIGCSSGSMYLLLMWRPESLFASISSRSRSFEFGVSVDYRQITYCISRSFGLADKHQIFLALVMPVSDRGSAEASQMSHQNWDYPNQDITEDLAIYEW